MLKPPQTYEMLPAAEQLLQAANVLDFSPYGGIIVANGDQLDLDSEDPLEQPDPASDGFWWRIVLMRQINGLGPPKQYMDNVIGYPFRVRIDVFPPNGDDSFNSVHFLEGAHLRCYEALHYKSIMITAANLEYPIAREEFPGSSHRDKTKGFRYMTATYKTGLGPVI